MKKAVKLAVKITGIAVAVVIILLAGVKIGEKLWFADFYGGAKVAFAIPELNKGFVPQGLTLDSETNKFLATGYSTEGASLVFAIPREGSRDVVRTKLKKADGSDYTGHTGGIERNGDFIYITGSDGLDIFRYSDIIAGGEAKQIGEFSTGVDPAHCHSDGKNLFVGSFYIAGDYETPANERIVTPAGDENTSVIEIYALDANAEFGIGDAVGAYSTRDKVQGMCFTEDKIVLSTSYGLSTSRLFAYDYAKQPAEGEYKIGDNTVPLKYLDSSNLVSVTKAPPMSEELVYADGRVVIFNESACNKYIFGKFMSGYDAYSIVIE